MSFGEDLFQPIGPFGGLNNTDSSLVIPSNKAQDLLNVEVSPGGRSIKKREGYGLFSNLAITTSAVHGVHNFFDSSGNSVDLYFNDQYISASVGGGTVEVISSTATAAEGATWQCVDSQGNAYCNNTSRTSLLKTNGDTFSYINTVNSTGTMVAVTPERLVTSGFSGAPNRIDFSKANDFNTWTIGNAATDPAQFIVVSPGSEITHIVYAFGRIIWFKDSSFGYIYIGQEEAQADWQVSTISPNIGTLDNTSVYREGILYFRGQDGHIWSYDGSNLEKLTRDIEGTISQSQPRRSNSWTQTTTSDFNAGGYVNRTFIDTTTVSGQISATYPDAFISFKTGQNGEMNVWKIPYGHAGIGTGTISAINGFLSFVSTGPGNGYFETGSVDSFPGLSYGTTYHITLSSITIEGAGSQSFEFVLSTFNFRGDGSVTDFNGATQRIARISMSSSSSGTVTTSASIGQTPTCGGGFTFTIPGNFYLWMNGTDHRIIVNGTTKCSGTHTISAAMQVAPIYSYMAYRRSIAAGSGTVLINDFSIFPATASYLSQINNSNDITSWDTFNATYLNNDGSFSFYLRAATNTFTVSSSTPVWFGPIVSGAIPSTTTANYFQIRTDFSSTDGAQTPSVFNDFTVNWFEGQTTDKIYGIYHEDAIWWAVSYSTSGATINNRILRYDLINSDWYIYDIGMNGMLIRNNDLYFGSSSEGKIFKFGDADSDNEAAINAYWKSKDFVVGDPFVQKDFKKLSVSVGSVSNSSMTVTYAIDGSSSTSYQFPLYAGVDSFKHFNKNLPLGKIGNTFNVQVGNNGADQPFEVFAIKFGYVDKPWIPSQ